MGGRVTDGPSLGRAVSAVAMRAVGAGRSSEEPKLRR